MTHQPSKHPRAKTGTNRPNTLNLHAEGVERLASRLDDAARERKGGRNAEFRRNYVRLPFRLESLPVRFTHPGGSVSELRLASRNLSSGGISLLHNRFVHVGTAVVVALPLQDGGEIEIHGTVRRCTHLSTILHEIGVQFERKIDARQFVPADRQSAFFSIEKVDPARLRGCVVLIDPGALGQKIFRHLLRNTQVRVRTAESFDAAMSLIEEGCDLIAADTSEDKDDLSAFMSSLRERGILTPVIAITGDAGPSARARLSEARVNAILVKPLTEGKLLQAVAEFLLCEPDDSAPDPDAGSGADAALVQGFIDELNRYADALSAELRAGNAARCLALATQIKGTAPVLGFHNLARLAANAADCLSSTNDSREAASALEDLILACRRAERTAA
jgi:CheY-like chemotaxis protein/HPt (histidine-containing phosphotransfer) domain-containing protein